MIKINFYPESDLKDFKLAIKEFEDIWKEYGEVIVNKWEEVTGLKFIETEITAVVADLKSCSVPLTLRYSNESDVKKSTLIHELGHRILYKRVVGMGKRTTLERHKFLFLVLHDVFLEMFGESFLKKVVDWDSQLQSTDGKNYYKLAWDWTSQFKTKIDRQKMFQRILSGEYQFLD